MHKTCMKSKTNRWSLGLSKWMGAALLVAGGLSACSDGYDLAEKTPDWLGSSIYDYLNGSGNFTNTVRLIDDLGYAEVLAKTGSKTLFVADDDAFNRFYQRNQWGVRRYEDLSTAQKKMLLNGSMINNACQVAYLSSTAAVDDKGPVEGDCMRRLTAQSEYDTVPVLKPQDMPDNPFWKRYRDAGKPIVCMSDRTVPPMIHLIESFLTTRLITNEDCNFLYNYTVSRQPGDADVNGVHMAEQNIKCSNGFVHRMAEVVTPLPNMADLITHRPNMQGYAKLLNRFCAPYRHDDKDQLTVDYNRLYNTNIDTLYELRYFSERSHASAAGNNRAEELVLTPDQGPVPGKLKFDPAWSQYYSATTSSTAANIALQQNMGVMLVPSDAALERYWNEGGGKALKDYYGSWDAVPDNVVADMINVNMINSFTGAVPSKFHTVLNDANDELGLKPEFIDSVFMASNGAVYMTNKVFNPVSYISVTFPAKINETMNVLYWAVEQCDYKVYLFSQNTYYSLFIPTNESLLEYVDPVSYGKSKTQIFKFHYKADAQTEGEKVWASIWEYDPETGTVGDSIDEATSDQVLDRLEYILESHIVIGNVEDGNEYYQTKGGSMVRVRNAAAGENGMQVQGAGQTENAQWLPVVKVYDQSLEGNGKAYIINNGPIQTARKSVNDILAEHPDYSRFYDLLSNSSLLETVRSLGTGESAPRYLSPSKNLTVFNTYRYTVYVPTNAAIKQMQDDGELPTWEDWEAETDTEKKDSLKNEIETFLRYHIQDDNFMIGAGSKSAETETSAYKVVDGNMSYYKLRTSADNSNLTVTDALGQTHNVTKAAGLYNLQACEYLFAPNPYSGFNPSSGMSLNDANIIYTTSFAVVHQIDGCLKYKQPTPSTGE